MLSDVSESELELSQPPIEKRKRTLVKKNNGQKKRIRVIDSSSSDSATDEFTPVQQQPGPKATATAAAAVATADVAEDTDLNDSLMDDYLKTNKDTLEDECGGQRTTQEDKDIIDGITDDDFNNGMLLSASTPLKSDRKKNQINALVVTENDRREAQFKSTMMSRIYKTHFCHFTTDIFTVPLPGIMTHQIKVYADGHIPTKISIWEKYQTVKGVPPQKIEVHPSDLKKFTEAVNLVFNMAQSDMPKDKVVTKKITLDNFGYSEIILNITGGTTKLLTIVQNYPESVKNIERQCLEVNPRYHMFKVASVIKIPLAEHKAFLTSLNLAVNFHDFLLASRNIHLKTLTEVANYYTKEAKNAGAGNHTHTKQEVYNYTLFLYHKLSSGVHDYPMRIIMREYLEKHEGEPYALKM